MALLILKKTFLIFLLVSRGFAFGINAKQDSIAVPTVLFKVTNSENQYVSYLFGTHHAFGKSFIDSLKNFNEALFSCDILIKENLNLPGHMAEEIINKRSSATKWKKFLNTEDYEYVKNIFSSSNVDFRKMTPTELYVFLNRYHKEEVCKSKRSSDNYLSLDDYIGDLAEENKLKLFGLETTEEQLEIIRKDVEGMPAKVHKKRLGRMISKIRSNNVEDCSEIEWYSEMNIDYKLDQPCQNVLVLTDRNNKWMTSIQKLLETENCFIAVGLSHLMFECGLINQLKDLGYTITPVLVK